MRDRLYLIGLALILAFSVYQYGGVRTSDWNFAVAALALLALPYWLSGPAARFAPPLDRTILILLIAAPLYIALQLLPMPDSVIRVIDPARHEISSALLRFNAAPKWIPISVAPSLTLIQLLRISAYIVVFFMARDIAWRYASRPWFACLPILLIGLAEALIGLAQHFTAGASATGTYVNPNHFAGFLEMALPFPVAALLIRRTQTPDIQSWMHIFRSCLLIASAAAIFVAMLYSFSRMGFAGALISLALLLSIAQPRHISRRRRFLMAVLMTSAVLLLVFFVVPDRLLQHLSGAQAGGEVTAEARFQFWRDTLRLVADYPVWGCGFGTYASAIQKYRTENILGLLDYAHNDYLQLLAELGIAGCAIFLTAASILLVRAYSRALRGSLTSHRLLAIACAVSLTAIALHSLVDFNFYIPSNALTAAWIAGVATALYSIEPKPRRVLTVKAHANL